MTESTNVKLYPTKDLKVEDGAEEIMRSPDMQPYLRLAGAVMSATDYTPALEEISKLPLEKRYIWRIVSGLKLAFCDFDNVSVQADLKTLAAADLQKVLDLIRMRPVQFCMFLKVLLGAENMEKVVTNAIKAAKG